LVCLYEGMLSALKGNPVRLQAGGEETKSAPTTGVHSDSARDVDIKFGYCTEFILESQEVDSDTIRDIMMGYGDSLVVVGYDGVIKVHVHTNNPGKALEEALKFGQLLTIKIENMRLQHENQIITDEEQEELDQVTAEDDFVVNEEEKDEKGKLIRQERYSGSMQRSFYVGDSIKQEDVKAKFEQGVLKLSFPKEGEKKLPEKQPIMIEG